MNNVASFPNSSAAVLRKAILGMEDSLGTMRAVIRKVPDEARHVYLLGKMDATVGAFIGAGRDLINVMDEIDKLTAEKVAANGKV